MPTCRHHSPHALLVSHPPHPHIFPFPPIPVNHSKPPSPNPLLQPSIDPPQSASAATAPNPATNPPPSATTLDAAPVADCEAIAVVVGAASAVTVGEPVNSWPEPPTFAREAGTDGFLVGDTLSLTLPVEAEAAWV